MYFQIVVRDLALGLLAASTACHAVFPTPDRLDPRHKALRPRADMAGIDSGKEDGFLLTSQRAAISNATDCAGGQCRDNATAVMDAAANGAASLELWTSPVLALVAAGSALFFFFFFLVLGIEVLPTWGNVHLGGKRRHEKYTVARDSLLAMEGRPRGARRRGSWGRGLPVE
ncbi:hypothetical protein PsYK624_075720 [Phanerochaete sordida]|uniref:Uncharacterized protein n=1 Tax=Phanerochaete sordida TaxID=48140 RepID=A0A9P3LEW8_9APHY|nr:hypothetical protein PsYK624_075720 [Phanerochaete sordida]